MTLDLELDGCRERTPPMSLPDYWLTRPNMARNANAQKAFDKLLTTTLGRGGCPTIPYTLPCPKGESLCHVPDPPPRRWQGPGTPGITLSEPRQSNDLNDFGNQKAVYAA